VLGKRDAERSQRTSIFSSLNWNDVMDRKMVSTQNHKLKKVSKCDITLEKLYGKGAFD